jgi:hypothetical protein
MARKEFDLIKEAAKMKAESEERSIESKIITDRAELAILSHLQNNGPSTIEDIIASGPFANLIDETLMILQCKGYVKEKHGYYHANPEKYKQQ